MKRLIAPIIACLLFSCSSQKLPESRVQPSTASTITFVRPTVQQASNDATNVTVSRRSWSITLPSNWLVAPDLAVQNNRMRMELVTKSIAPLGRGAVIVQVRSLELEKDDDGSLFGASIVKLARQSGKANVLKSIVRPIDGKNPGTISLLTLPNGALVLQYAYASSGVGYVAMCGGDPEQADKLLGTCKDILDTFHVNAH